MPRLFIFVSQRNVSEDTGMRFLPCKSRGYSLQASLEHLAVYGWAILVIAIVMAFLMALGVFSPYNFSPRAQPGSCSVYRPGGAGSVSSIGLEGVCNGDIPTYVAQFNGASSLIVSQNSLPQMSSTTVTWWTKVAPSSGSSGMGIYECQVYEPAASSTTFTAYWDPCSCIGYSNCGSNAPLTAPTSDWVMFAFVANGNVITSYSFNSPTQNTQNSGVIPATPYAIPAKAFYIGSYDGNPIYNLLNGYIANVQLYNASLSANEIKALYNAGIGGAP